LKADYNSEDFHGTATTVMVSDLSECGRSEMTSRVTWPRQQAIYIKFNVFQGNYSYGT